MQLYILSLFQVQFRIFQATAWIRTVPGSLPQFLLRVTILLVIHNSSGDTGSGGDTAADTTQPSVVSISPSENASSITVDSAVTVVFSESISSASLSSSTFKLMDNSSNSISGSYSLNGSTVTFTPTDNLTHFRDYSVSLTTGIKDSAGNALYSAKSWIFSTLSNVVVISADSFGMVLLSGGQFEMGADNESQSDGTGNSRELPVHTVTLTGPFYVSDHEVTAAEYKACVDAGNCSYTGSTTNSKRTYDVSGEENFPINYQLNIKLVWMQVAAAIQAVQQIQSGPTMFPEKKIFR